MAPVGFGIQVEPEVVARAGKGDLEALEHLFCTFERPVYTLAYRVCGCREDADDVLQETFLEVVRSLGNLREAGAFGTWLRRVAANKALMKLRSLSRTRNLQSGFDGNGDCFAAPFDPVDRIQINRIDLERALMDLSETSRAVVWLHDVEGMTHREIGAAMGGRTASFSKSQLSRAHARLRQSLGSQQEYDHEASEYRRVAGTPGR
jgi:RNA polymerase sigma-70 factor (ECF subfamily)